MSELIGWIVAGFLALIVAVVLMVVWWVLKDMFRWWGS